MNIVAKTNPNCSNVFFIDENLCIGNTLNLINSNVKSLSSIEISLDNQQQGWLSLYNTFVNYRDSIVTAYSNMVTYSATWVDFSSTVANLSGDWNKPFTIFYPQMIKTSTWNGNNKSYWKKYFSDWLGNNFSSDNYPQKQKITVGIYIWDAVPVPYSFSRTLNESCTPNCQGQILGCNSANCQTPYQGCNHHGGKAGVKGCDNVFSYCTTKTNQAGYVENKVACRGFGGKTLRVAYSVNNIDTHVRQLITMSFILYTDTWVFTA